MIKVIKVKCKTHMVWIDEVKVKFLNIEEGDRGQDILTFICPLCNQQHSSPRVG